MACKSAIVSISMNISSAESPLQTVDTPYNYVVMSEADERGLSCDDVLETLPPKISLFFREPIFEMQYLDFLIGESVYISSPASLPR
jgi:hypothetical protein